METPARDRNRRILVSRYLALYSSLLSLAGVQPFIEKRYAMVIYPGAEAREAYNLFAQHLRARHVRVYAMRSANPAQAIANYLMPRSAYRQAARGTRP